MPRTSSFIQGTVFALTILLQHAASTSEPFVGIEVNLGHDDVVAYQGQPGSHKEGIGEQQRFDPAPYAGSVGTNEQVASGFELPIGLRSWAFVQKPASPAPFPYAVTERDISLQYSVSFSALQHPANSVENKAEGETSKINYRVGLVTAAAADAAQSYDEVSAALLDSCKWQVATNRQPYFLEDGCSAVNISPDNHRTWEDLPVHPESNSSDVWHSHAWTFSTRHGCESCVLVVIGSHDNSWASYWGSTLYISELKVERVATEVPTREFADGTHEKIQLRHATEDPNSATTNCPHLTDGGGGGGGALLSWGVPSTWPVVAGESSSRLPTADDGVITIPTNSRIIMEAGEYGTKEAPLQQIVVEAGAELVLDDANITIHVKEIRVLGTFSAGAPTCRLDNGHIRLAFHGTEAAVMDGVDSAGPGLGGVGMQPTKGLVSEGGTVDLHGRLFQPTWTRLSSTVYAGDVIIHLADSVAGMFGWLLGMEIFVTTTTFDDRAAGHGGQPENERRTIRSISADGKRVEVDRAFAFRHHGGAEYQAEVGLLTRRIVLDGIMEEEGGSGTGAESEPSEPSHAGFGGHTAISSGGSGRFSGVEAVNMGQTNVRGRYPFHWHLLGMDVDPSSTIVEAGGGGANGTVLLEPAGAWHAVDLANHTGDRNFWQGGVADQVFYQSCIGNYCSQDADLSATFTFDLQAPADGGDDALRYDLLISQPPNKYEVTGLQHWNSVFLTGNVTVTIMQDSVPVVASFVFNQKLNDPVDVMKKWNLLVGNLMLAVPTGASSTLTVQLHNVDTCAGKCAIAVDAIQLRRSPQGRNFLRDSSIHDSFYRCASIHGTNDVLVSKNVAHNVRGHCFYLEDGVEERSTIEYNLASFIHPIGQVATGAAQIGTIRTESADLRNPADSAAAGFYITNARNYIYGNAASGGWTGFSFPNVPLPLGAFAAGGFDFGLFNPESRLELEFDGNSAHSAGIEWINGNCVYVGGKLTHDDDAAGNKRLGPLRYMSGRNQRSSYDAAGERAGNTFTNLLVYLCRRGINHWGNNADVVGYKAVDVMQGAVIFGRAYLHRALIQAESTNINARLTSHLGFQFYDTSTQTILNDVIFRNFHFVDGDLADSTDNTRSSFTNRVFEPMDHSDTWKPQGISAIKNMQYDNSDRLAKFDFPGVDTGAGYMYNIVDFDGRSVGRDDQCVFPPASTPFLVNSRPTILGSHISYWNLGCDCSFDPVYKGWLCDKVAGREIGMLSLEIEGFTRAAHEMGRIESHRHIGYLCQYPVADFDAALRAGDLDQGDLHECLLLTKNYVTTGVTTRVWHYRFFGGGSAEPVSSNAGAGALGKTVSPIEIKIAQVQIPANNYIIAAFDYPTDTLGFNVSIFATYSGGNHVYLPEASSLDQLLLENEVLTEGRDATQDCPAGSYPDNVGTLCNASNVGPSYFWDASVGVLYLRVVDPGWYLNRIFKGAGVYERDGIWLNTIQYLASYHITAHCGAANTITAPDGTEMCATGNDRPLPLATRPSGDSCSTASPSSMLPARVEWANTVAAAWQVPNSGGFPNFTQPFQMQVDGILSLSATSGGVWQFDTQEAFAACDTSSGISLYTFVQQQPAFDVHLAVSGRYFFGSTDVADCNNGLKLEIIVIGEGGGGGQTQVAPLMTPPALPFMPANSCTEAASYSNLQCTGGDACDNVCKPSRQRGVRVYSEPTP